MKFAICNEIFQGWEIGDAMRFAADAGYHGIELAPFTLARTVTEISAPQRGRIRESAERAGLEICGLHWLLAKTEGFHLTHSDPAVRERTAQYLCELANCCADLGGKVLVLGSPQQRNVAADVSMEQARAWAAETLAPGLKTAEDRHVLWCIEPLAPGETNFLNTAAEAIEFARQLNSRRRELSWMSKPWRLNGHLLLMSFGHRGRILPISTPTIRTAKARDSAPWISGQSSAR